MELTVCLLKGMDVRIFQSNGDLVSKYPYLLVRYIVCQDFFQCPGQAFKKQPIGTWYYPRTNQIRLAIMTLLYQILILLVT